MRAKLVMRLSMIVGLLAGPIAPNPASAETALKFSLDFIMFGPNSPFVYADEHGYFVTPPGINRRASTTCIGIVDDIIVHERGCMDQLNHGRELNCSRSYFFRGYRSGRQKKQGWSDPFAAAFKEVIADSGYNLDI